MVTGVFLGYRRGKHTQRNKQILIRINGVKSSDDAAGFIGRRVIWKSGTGKILVGKITGIHGRRGFVRAAFKKGLPGQALGSKIKII